MMLEIDDIDETENMAVEETMTNQTMSDNDYNNSQPVLTKEERMQRLLMKQFFTSQMHNNDDLAKQFLLKQLASQIQGN